MYDTIISDIRKNPVQSIAVVAFAFTSCFLIALGAMMYSLLLGSADRSMEASLTPHFLQMHSGSLEGADFSAFIDSPEVEAFQILPYLNIDNNAFLFEGKPFIKGGDDNGVCCQSESFDFLLSSDGEILTVDDGGIYVPTYYSSAVTEGGTLSVAGEELVVRGFLTDAQMGSSLSSSKRFLVSRNTFEIPRESGRVEYLIEARGSDASSAGKIGSLYAALDLPSNGPAVTYSLIRMMNALSEGIMAVLIILSGIIATLISLVSLRYIFLIASERDERRIAIYEAMGIRKGVIVASCTLKYALLMALGALLSFGVLSMVMDSSETGISLLIHFSVFFLLVLWAFSILFRITGKDIVSALRMSGRKKRGKGALLLIAVLSALMYFLAFLPGGASSTLSSRSFVSSMGIGDADIRIDLKGEGRDEVEEYLSSASYVSSYALYDTFRVNVLSGDVSAAVPAESGDHGAFPLKYAEGRLPLRDDEAALSVLLAKDLGAGLGDTVLIEGDVYTVVGLYGDITNGGRTCKVARSPLSDVMWTVGYVNTPEPDRLLADIHTLFPLSKADTIAAYVTNLYGRTIENIGFASDVALAAAMLIEAILLVLISSLMTERDRKTITLKLATGIRRGEIIPGYILRLGASVAAGVALGVVLAMVFGPAVLSLMLSALGASGVRFVPSYIHSLIVLPLSFLSMSLISALAGMLTVFRIRPSDIRRALL